jgi:hypothetical protein
MQRLLVLAVGSPQSAVKLRKVVNLFSGLGLGIMPLLKHL